MPIQCIDLGNQKIGPEDPTFIIAEAGINHNGDMKTALKLIDAAAEAGVNAVKFQTYITEQRVPKDSPIYGILKQCELSQQLQKELYDYAQSKEVLFFSTPFDRESVDFLKELDVPLMKIASFDITNLDLLKYVAATKIPTIMSRGMADTNEIDIAYAPFEQNATPLVLLHCISSYPTPEEHANLNVIRALQARYSYLIGYSDHTLGNRVPGLAVAAGAKVIEKHFTLDRNLEGPDHALSCDPAGMKDLVQQIREIETVLGQGLIQMYETEKATAVYRRVSQ